VDLRPPLYKRSEGFPFLELPIRFAPFDLSPWRSPFFFFYLGFVSQTTPLFCWICRATFPRRGPWNNRPIFRFSFLFFCLFLSHPSFFFPASLDSFSLCDTPLFGFHGWFHFPTREVIDNFAFSLPDPTLVLFLKAMACLPLPFLRARADCEILPLCRGLAPPPFILSFLPGQVEFFPLTPSQAPLRICSFPPFSFGFFFGMSPPRILF